MCWSQSLATYSLQRTCRPIQKKYSGSWNFGPSSAEIRTVKEVADSLVGHIGRGRVDIVDIQEYHEANLLQLNCDKAAQLLGWRPRWHVDKTLAATAQWYKTMLDGGDATTITRLQLKDYFQELL